MRGRSGRVLPSVTVSAVLIAGLALGAGTASAAVLSPSECAAQLGTVQNGQCLDVTGALIGTIQSATSGLTEEEVAQQAAEAAQLEALEQARQEAARQAALRAAQEEAQRRAAEERRARQLAVQQAAQQQAAEQAAALQRAQQEAAREAALRAQAAAQPVPSQNLLSPAGGGSGLVTGVPVGTVNPALLMAPVGNPLRTLGGENGGSPVTTASQVQAMAFDQLPGGLGTPSVAGVLILSTFAAFALRHRVLRRARLAALDEADADADLDTEADLDADEATEVETDEFARV